MPHRDTSLAIKQDIALALNATQGHKRSYQTSYYSCSKCHTGTQALAIYQALYQSLFYTEVSSQSEYSTGVQLLYTVIKAEFFFELIVFKVYRLQVKMNRKKLQFLRHYLYHMI